MKSKSGLHPIQNKILESLRFSTRARFSELQHVAGMTSDTFKFHLQKVQKLEYVIKSDDGLYELTASGKAFAERLDSATGVLIAQPKNSLLFIVRSGRFVLAHQRTREPFNDYWGIASAPLLRGVEIRESAKREYYRQTGLRLDFRVAGSYRMIDTTPGGKILEDKLCTLMAAEMDRMPIPQAWTGGKNEWMTVDDLLQKNPIFPATAGIFAMLDSGVWFREDRFIYRDNEY